MMCRELYSYQLTDDCIAITDVVSANSVLFVKDTCMTYTLLYDSIVEHTRELSNRLSHAIVRSRSSKNIRKVLNDGVRVVENDNGSVSLYANGEYAELIDDNLFVSKHFEIHIVLDSLSSMLSKLPSESPTLESSAYRARYVKDGNLVIVNSVDNCMVFNAHSLKDGIIENCLVNTKAYSGVTLIVANNELLVKSGDKTVFTVPLDRSVCKYLQVK